MKNFIKSIVGPNLLYVIKKYLFNIVDELYVVHKFLKKKKNDRGIMLDVGVHFGTSSIPFLESGWQVYGFEPDKSNIQEAKKRIPANSNFTLFDYAISDKPGKMDFYISNQSTGISGLHSFHKSHTFSHIVKVETLNNVILEHKIGPIKLVKIDAEGYDLNVLKGLNLIKNDSIEFIICEFEDEKTKSLGYSVRDMIEYLQNFGFEIIVCEWEPIIEYGSNHKFRKAKAYPCELNSDSWGNLIAYKNAEFKNFALKQFN